STLISSSPPPARHPFPTRRSSDLSASANSATRTRVQRPASRPPATTVNIPCRPTCSPPAKSGPEHSGEHRPDGGRTTQVRPPPSSVPTWSLSDRCAQRPRASSAAVTTPVTRCWAQPADRAEHVVPQVQRHVEHLQQRFPPGVAVVIPVDGELRGVHGLGLLGAGCIPEREIGR